MCDALHTTSAMPLSPEWANLPRRRCDNCGKTYKPVRPRRTGEMGFCKDNCRKEYHKYGGAFRKLRGEIEKEVLKQLAKRYRLLEPCEMCDGRGQSKARSPARGPKTVYGPCEKCNGLGTRISAYGRDLKEFLEFSGRMYPKLT